MLREPVPRPIPDGDMVREPGRRDGELSLGPPGVIPVGCGIPRRKSAEGAVFGGTMPDCI